MRKMRKLSESDFKAIAEEAGVSTITVRKWFNDHLSVKRGTEEKIVLAFIAVSKKSVLSIDDMIMKHQQMIHRINDLIGCYELQKRYLIERIELADGL